MPSKVQKAFQTPCGNHLHCNRSLNLSGKFPTGEVITASIRHAPPTSTSFSPPETVLSTTALEQNLNVQKVVLSQIAPGGKLQHIPVLSHRADVSQAPFRASITQKCW